MIRLAALVLFLVACSGSPGGPNMNNRMAGPDPVAQSSDVISADILAREPVANNAKVKHVLIGWEGMDGSDERAKKRTKADAEALVNSLMTQIKAGANFEMLMKQHSEDPGSIGGNSYDVSPDAGLVIEFKQLSLRLNVNEVGVVQTNYGFHIIKRVE
ncbi:MAG TPA: peptidylprolyl isomerase [Kofleriaceae bacterium]|nr:peptidylprolyl isomerase [Kofleriaceae bacterium]